VAAEAAALASGSPAPCEGGPEQRVDYWRQLGQLLSSADVLVFLSLAVTMGYGVGTIEGFLFLYLAELGAGNTYKERF
jgi:hypothetical protein